MTDIRDAAMQSLGFKLFNALAGRGHSPSEMLAMEPMERFREYCGWHFGDPGWAKELACMWVAANFDGDPASVDRSPKGEKPQALNAKHESAVGDSRDAQGEPA